MLCKRNVVKNRNDEQTCADALVPSFTSGRISFLPRVCALCMDAGSLWEKCYSPGPVKQSSTVPVQDIPQGPTQPPLWLPLKALGILPSFL